MNLSAVIKVVRRFAPVVVPVVLKMWQDPRLRAQIQEVAAKLVASEKPTAQDMLATIEVLRSQVRELAASADDAGEVRRAEEWQKQLDGYEKAAHLLTAPGATTKDHKKLRRRIDTLRSRVLDAHMTEIAEDHGVQVEPRPSRRGRLGRLRQLPGRRARRRARRHDRA